MIELVKGTVYCMHVFLLFTSNIVECVADQKALEFEAQLNEF
jgi:hypothetical protein